MHIDGSLVDEYASFGLTWVGCEKADVIPDFLIKFYQDNAYLFVIISPANEGIVNCVSVLTFLVFRSFVSSIVVTFHHV